MLGPGSSRQRAALEVPTVDEEHSENDETQHGIGASQGMAGVGEERSTGTRTVRTRADMFKVKPFCGNATMPMAYMVLVEEPTTLEEARASKEAAKWEEVVQDELKSLEENGTWEECLRPKDRNIVGCKWVFKLKSPQVDGGSYRYKARLVAKGYSQRKGIDYHETFAPVIKYQSLRILLAVATQRGMNIFCMSAAKSSLLGCPSGWLVWFVDMIGFLVKQSVDLTKQQETRQNDRQGYYLQ
jgi:hypothetical protein